MRIRLMIAAAATAALFAGGAFAQNDTAVNPPTPNAAPPSATGDAAPAQSPGPAAPAGASANSPSTDASTVAPAAGAPTERAPAASAGTELLTNGPVPDTRANRAKYGQPLSHAGRATRAAGN